jgi:hypothetical protein
MKKRKYNLDKETTQTERKFGPQFKDRTSNLTFKNKK